MGSSGEKVVAVCPTKGHEKHEACCLDLAACSEGNHFTSEHFHNLTMLRFFQMDHTALSGDFRHLFEKLRWLQREGCPSDFMLSNFHPENLVALDLSYSQVTEHWGGWKHFELAKKLKVLRLEHCFRLVVSPDFSAFTELEILSLEGCKNLQRIHQSIGHVSKLVILNIRGCHCLKELPAEVGQIKELKELLVDRTSIETIPISEGSLGKLEILSASRCESLVKLPGTIGHLKSLSKLDLSWCTNLIELPDSIGFLERLSSLILRDCHSLTKIPKTIGELKSLTELRLTASHKLMVLPDSIGDLGSLEVLNIRASAIKNLPSATRKLRNLKTLDVSYTPLQTDIPWITELSSLECLELENSDIAVLPQSLSKFSNFHILNLSNCNHLEALPELPFGLSVLKFSCISMKTFPDISNLHDLKHLEICYFEKEKHLEFCLISETVSGMLKIGSLNKLEILRVVCSTVVVNDFAIFPELKMLELCNVSISSLSIDINAFYKLRKLRVDNCMLLEYLPELPYGLEELRICRCPMLKKIADLSNLKHLFKLEVEYCSMLMEITGLEGLESLCQMTVTGCKKLVLISRLNSMKHLKHLFIGDCTFLEETSVEDIEKSTSLKKLHLSGCKFMENFPNLSKLRDLEVLTITHADELVEIPGLENLLSLRCLVIMDCKSLESLPDFSIFTALQSLMIYRCEKLKKLQGLESLDSSCMVDIRGNNRSERPGSSMCVGIRALVYPLQYLDAFLQPLIQCLTGERREKIKSQ